MYINWTQMCEYAVLLMRSPMTWICFTTIHFVLAVYVGEVVSAKWREKAIWLPLGLLAALAMRPWPKGPIVEDQPGVVATVEVGHAYYQQGGLYHERWCERLGSSGPASIRTSEAEAIDAGLGACPDCIRHPVSAQ